MRYGVSLFALNPTLIRDHETVLTRLRAANYRYLEPVITTFDIPQLAGHLWRIEDLAPRRALYEQYGFTIESCHLFSRDVLKDIETLLPELAANGIRQVVLICPNPKTPAEGIMHAETLRATAKLLREKGILLLLHNGDDVSAARMEGISVYEWMLHACGETVGAQVDIGWLIYGQVDPETFLWRNAAQVRSFHYKDMDAEGKEIAIGKGVMDMEACFQFARAHELVQYADQDSSRGDLVEDLEQCGYRLRQLSGCRPNTESTLCVVDAFTGEVTELKHYDHVVEAPNWSAVDPDKLFYNADGRIYRYSISTGEDIEVDTDTCVHCNNDHVLSADGREIAVSHADTGWMSAIYIIPLNGGAPRRVTENIPSFLHGWSPDGEELCYCAFRDHGKGMEVDVYAVSREGGEERRLTKDAGFNDGPEYSPDGKDIWFISSRTGLMQCYRMDRDGGNQTQMTFTERNNWFPHISPDNSRVLYISYSRDCQDASEHLPNLNVELRLMNADGTDDHTLLRFFGGQGSVNVNSWSPDSRRAAFVKYELKHR